MILIHFCFSHWNFFHSNFETFQPERRSRWDVLRPHLRHWLRKLFFWCIQQGSLSWLPSALGSCGNIDYVTKVLIVRTILYLVCCLGRSIDFGFTRWFMSLILSYSLLYGIVSDVSLISSRGNFFIYVMFVPLAFVRLFGCLFILFPTSIFIIPFQLILAIRLEVRLGIQVISSDLVVEAQLYWWYTSYKCLDDYTVCWVINYRHSLEIFGYKFLQGFPFILLDV